MKFVPVPGTEVAFCIWETRVKDYTAYAAANSGVDGSWENFGIAGFKQADTHLPRPVKLQEIRAGKAIS